MQYYYIENALWKLSLLSHRKLPSDASREHFSRLEV